MHTACRSNRRWQLDSDMTFLVLQYETDGLDMADTVTLFQYLIDTDMAWTLQGHYGRTAQALIDQGLCHVAQNATG